MPYGIVFCQKNIQHFEKIKEGTLLEVKEIKINPMWDNYPEIKEELIRCKMFMLESIDIPNEEVRNQVLNLINKDAKFIRPALMVTIGKMYNGGEKLEERFIKIAGTLEMLHMATLIHDDIVDDSPKRRGFESLQSSMGKDIAVYAGDYMLSTVFSNVVKYAGTMENIEKITKTVNEILAGELIQMEYRNRFDITEEKYYEIIKGKTAVMIALCCYEGAYMAGEKEKAEKAWEFGESVGMAFQMIDDILDFTMDSYNAKKPVNQDFKEGNFTLPIIKSKDRYEKELKNIKNRNIYSDNDNEEIRKIVKISGGIDYAKSVSEDYSRKSIMILNDFENVRFKKYLSELVSKMLNRRY